MQHRLSGSAAAVMPDRRFGIPPNNSRTRPRPLRTVSVAPAPAAPDPRFVHSGAETIPEPDAQRFDAAAARLLETLLAVPCGESFALSLSSALDAALRLLDAEPELAEILLDRDCASVELLEIRVSWGRTLAHLLHNAARAAGCRQAPFFFEPQLIAGIDWTIAASHRKPGVTCFAEARASLLRYLLVYYLEPDELGPAVLACLDVGP